MKKGMRIETDYKDGKFYFTLYGAKNEILLSLPEGDKIYQGHFIEDGNLYIGIYTPEIGPATYEFTENGLILKEKHEH